MHELEGKTAVVTGASQGIGRAIALDLAGRGARVAALARGTAGLEETLALGRDLPGPLRAVECDITDAQAVARVAETVQADGPVHALVNNAGMTRDGLLLRMKEDDWQQVLDTNLTGAFRMCRAFLAGMVRARSGRIVNVSSVVASAGNPGQANYAASKAGLLGFTRALAREVASRNVTVNAVAPGYIDTSMTGGLPEKARNALLAQIPLGAMGRPEDVAAAVAFLISDGARYITGQVLHVNGGMYM